MNNGRIGDVFEYISRGKSPQYVDQSSVHVINQACIRWDGIDFSKVKYQNPTTIKKDAILNVGDLLISSTGTGTLGRCCVFDGGDESITYVADSHVTVIRKSDIVLPSFAKYYLMHDATQRELYAQCVNGSTNQIELSKEKFKKFLIPVPRKEVQQSIVIILEKIEELIALRKEQLTKLDQLVKSRFIELFGDPITNTKEWKFEKAEKHIDLLSGFPFDSSQYTEFGIRICGGLIIMPQRIDWDSCKYWRSTEGFEDYILREKDIVMALDRPWISEGFKIAMVDADKLPALLIQRTARIRAVDINQHYLMYCFILGGFDNHCNVTGSLVPHISAKDIRSFPIMLPPMELQEQFEAFVEQTAKSKMAIQQSLDKLELLKESLMQEYFG